MFSIASRLFIVGFSKSHHSPETVTDFMDIVNTIMDYRTRRPPVPLQDALIPSHDPRLHVPGQGTGRRDKRQ
eukprot:10554690-Lingulodinium_polyedra.AAC.1